MPPICTIDMSGTAAKLKSSPASVTREKKSGPSGSSATSAAADAASSASAGRRSGATSAADMNAGTPSTIAIVAPKVKRKPGSTSASGLPTRMSEAATARALAAEVR